MGSRAVVLAGAVLLAALGLMLVGNVGVGVRLGAVEAAKKRDYYQLLGVKRGASEKEIKKGYRKAALRFHPDRHQDPDKKAKAEKWFMEISKAYETLSDPEKREIYDQYGEEGVEQAAKGGAPGGGGGGPGQGFGGFNFGSGGPGGATFSFGGGGGGGGRGRGV